MHILILNWRDIENPMAGGAEVLTHEMAKRWVDQGNRVTLFTSSFAGAPAGENLEGVRIIRRGKWWNVQIWAFFYYIFRLHHPIDIIIDEVHWYPFFSRLYAGKKVVLLVCEVANRLFFHLFPYPLALLGRGIEKIYFFLNKTVPALTISPSTKQDLIQEGFKEENITVLPMGLTLPKVARAYKKQIKPTFLFVGRIHPLKGVSDAIDAMGIIRATLPQSQLWIVGNGQPSYVFKLRKRTHDLHLNKCIHFLGYVSEEEKVKLFQQAHLLFAPSVQEGWGLTVPEAAYQGTPAVAYNTSGLRDVVVNGVTGILTDNNTPEELAKAALGLWENNKLYGRFQKAGKARSHTMSWDKTASVAFGVLERVHHTL